MICEVKYLRYANPKSMEVLCKELSEFRVSLSDFEIGKRIGDGGFSDVYIGMQTSTGKLCAIKILKAKDLRGESLTIYEREIRILAKGSNKFILGFVGFTSTYPYTIVTEYAAKGTLYDAIHYNGDSPVLTGTQKTIIALGIAYGMHRLHKIRIIHRDLKSPNVLLDESCLPKVSDFGLSRYVDNPNTLLTVDIGTPRWMAPELFEKRDYTNKVDVYAYGILLWEMVTGTYPFKGQNPVQIAYSVCKLHERPKIPHRAPRCLKELISSCWAQDPSVRPSFKRIYKHFAEGKVKFPETDDAAVQRVVNSMKDEVIPEHPSRYKKYHLPSEFKSEAPYVPFGAPQENDLDQIKNCSSPTFIRDLENVKRKLAMIDVEQYFRILLGHLANTGGMKTAVQNAILLSVAQQISSSQHFFQMFLEANLLQKIPFGNRQLIDANYQLLLPLFMQIPQVIPKSVFDALIPIIPERPLYMLRIINIYICLHPPTQLFWNVADILITQTTHFQGSVCETYLQLLFTVCQMIDAFRTSRFRYIVNILLHIIKIKSGRCMRIAYNMLAFLLDKTNDPTTIQQIKTNVLARDVQNPEMSETAMSILLRLTKVEPEALLITELMKLSRENLLAATLLLNYCEFESVALDLAQNINAWAAVPLPTIEHTMKIIMVIMTHSSSHAHLAKSPQLHSFFAGVLKTRKPELVRSITVIERAFTATPDFIALLASTQFLTNYIEISCSMKNPVALADCFQLIAKLASVSWNPTYLKVIPILRVIFHDGQGSWVPHAVCMIRALAKHDEARKMITDDQIDTIYGLDCL